jgi:uncharacterized protein YecE (DUF72 family)
MIFEEPTSKILREPLQQLARESVFIGTSSWKYPGWCGQVYDESRYITRKKFSESRFERECLTEYAETFPAVCVDAGYYKFPSPQYLEGLSKQVPDSFRFGFKVTDTITLKNYTNLPRFGAMAGKPNEHFLNADLFKKAFLSSFDRIQDKAGVFIFEFSHFYPKDFEHGRDFVVLLDEFFSQLPKTYSYAVEVRNKSLLQPEYFSMLGSHGVAHVFNSWTKMPEVAEQIQIPGSITTDFTVARLLLKPGRTYEQAVSTFSPYKSVQEPNIGVREAAKTLVQKARGGKRPSFVFVNNRLEGNAPTTIRAILNGTES